MNQKTRKDRISSIQYEETPNYPVFTTEFDRECSAQELYHERKVPDFSRFREDKIANISSSAISDCHTFAQRYKDVMIERHGYILPITLLLDNS